MPSKKNKTKNNALVTRRELAAARARIRDIDFVFPRRQVIVPVADVLARGDKAFVTAALFPIVATSPTNYFSVQTVLPALVVNDGMSIAGILQCSLQGEDGLGGGAIHDILYSRRGEANLRAILTASGLPVYTVLQKILADQILYKYLCSACPGFSDFAAWRIRFAVARFGAKHFQNSETDKWRAQVSRALGDIPGGGFGIHREPTEKDLAKILNRAPERP